MPWLLLDWPAQVIGVVLIVVGSQTKQLAVTIKKPEEQTFRVRPYFNPGGGGMFAAGVF